MRFDAGLADHVDRLMSIEVPGLCDLDRPSPYGVVRGWSLPRLVPMVQVLNRKHWAQVRTGVYAALNDDALVTYVGSVRRQEAALAPRMRHHFRIDPRRCETWTQLALIELPDSLEAKAVLRCEGRVGRALDPLDNERLPAVPGRRPWVPRARQD